jgi:hypothetical protein
MLASFASQLTIVKNATLGQSFHGAAENSYSLEIEI